MSATQIADKAPRVAQQGAPTPGARRVVAYLTTSYPAVSHTFIRREIAALERMGTSVVRMSIRPPGARLVDPADVDEASKTVVCLAQPAWRLLGAAAGMALRAPVRFAGALAMTMGMSRASDRGLFRHLAYLVEACFLLGVVRCAGAAHVHTHFGTNSCSVARLMRRLGGPTYSFTVHGPDELDNVRGHSLAGKIADSAFVVGITDFCAAQLRRWTPPAAWGKIRVVRCAVGDDWFDNAAPTPDDARSIVCVGRLSAQKGQLLLIEAFARAIGAGDASGQTIPGELILAGDGEMRAEVEAAIAARGLEGRVRITGWIGEAEVRRLLLASRALVLGSFAEGLPVVIMEAFALERPVIATYIAGIPELVRDGENGWLVPAGNVPALAEAIRSALTAPAARLRAMGERGRAATRERHHTQTEAAKLMRHIEDAIERAGRAA